MEIIISVINTVVLGVTAMIVWLYTQAAQKSNEIQERPLLNLKAIEDNVGPNSITFFKVKNVGKGPAYNIQFATIGTSEGYVYGPYLKEDVNSMLETGAEEEVKFWVRTPTGGTEVYARVLGFQWFSQRLFMTGENRIAEDVRKTAGIFLIHYEGLSGKTYHSIFRFYPTLELAFDHGIFVEFIATDQGIYGWEKAKKVCLERPLIKHMGLRVREHE